MFAAGIITVLLIAIVGGVALRRLLIRKSAKAFIQESYRRQYYSKKTLTETFDLVYARAIWGSEPGSRLYSGEGARGEIFERYCALVGSEIVRRGIGSLVDIGCGDFKVGGVLAGMVTHYTGVDVSELVVAANQTLHASPQRTFIRADATKDPLPAADAAVIRQVLQHLSNAEIESVLKKVLGLYRTVFITEHIHADSDSRPNRDMFHGPHTRVAERSGVRIDLPPFEVPASLVGDIPYAPGELLRTWVVER